MSYDLTKRLRNSGVVAAMLSAAACSGGGQVGSPALPASGSFATSANAQQIPISSMSVSRANASTQQSSLPYQSAVLADSPSAFFTLSGSGSSATSLINPAFSGAFGSSVLRNGKSLTSDGNASAQFNGGTFNTANIVTFAPNAALAPANTVSVEFWIELTQKNPTGTMVPIIAYGSQAYTFPYEVSLTFRDTLKFSIRGAAPYYTWGYEESQTLVPGKPYHIVATYDGSMEHMYVDGQQTLSVKAPGPLQYAHVASSPSGLTVGGEVGTGRNTINALISDVAIYPTALAQSAASRHFVAGQIGSSTTSIPATPAPAPLATATPIANGVSEMPKSVFAFQDSIGFDSHFNYANSPYVPNGSADAALIEQLPAHHLRDGGTGEANIMASLCAAGVHHSFGFPINVTASQITQTLNEQNPACIDYVEPANEYDNSRDPNWAANMMAEEQTIYTTIKSNPAFSHITVLGPGLANANKYAMLPGIAQISDAASFHDGECDGSPLTKHYANVATKYAALKAAYSASKPVWTTEVAVANNPGLSGCGLSLQAAAKYVPRQLLVRFNLGMPRNYYNEFSEFPAIGGWGVLGVVDANANPYPAYLTLHSLMHALPAGQSAQTSLSSLTYALTGATSDVNHTLLQAADGTYYMIVWAEVDSWNVKTKSDVSAAAQAVTLTLPSNVKQVTVSNPNSNYSMTSANVTPVGGSVPLSVTDAPMVVSFHL